MASNKNNTNTWAISSYNQSSEKLLASLKADVKGMDSINSDDFISDDKYRLLENISLEVQNESVSPRYGYEKVFKMTCVPNNNFTDDFKPENVQGVFVYEVGDQKKFFYLIDGLLFDETGTDLTSKVKIVKYSPIDPSVAQEDKNIPLKISFEIDAVLRFQRTKKVKGFNYKNKLYIPTGDKYIIVFDGVIWEELKPEQLTYSEANVKGTNLLLPYNPNPNSSIAKGEDVIRFLGVNQNVSVSTTGDFSINNIFLTPQEPVYNENPIGSKEDIDDNVNNWNSNPAPNILKIDNFNSIDQSIGEGVLVDSAIFLTFEIFPVKSDNTYGDGIITGRNIETIVALDKNKGTQAIPFATYTRGPSDMKYIFFDKNNVGDQGFDDRLFQYFNFENQGGDVYVRPRLNDIPTLTDVMKDYFTRLVNKDPNIPRDIIGFKGVILVTLPYDIVDIISTHYTFASTILGDEPSTRIFDMNGFYKLYKELLDWKTNSISFSNDWKFWLHVDNVSWSESNIDNKIIFSMDTKNNNISFISKGIISGIKEVNVTGFYNSIYAGAELNVNDIVPLKNILDHNNYNVEWFYKPVTNGEDFEQYLYPKVDILTSNVSGANPVKSNQYFFDKTTVDPNSGVPYTNDAERWQSWVGIIPLYDVDYGIFTRVNLSNENFLLGLQITDKNDATKNQYFAQYFTKTLDISENDEFILDTELKSCTQAIVVDGQLVLFGGTKKNRLFFSAPNKFNYFPSDNYLDLNINKGESIQDIQWNDSQYVVFTDSEIYKLVPDNNVFKVEPVNTTYGTFNGDSVVSFGNLQAFLSRDGFKTIDTRAVANNILGLKNLDEPIRNLIQTTINANNNQVLGQVRNTIAHWFFPLTKTCWKYYIYLDAWTVDTSDYFENILATYIKINTNKIGFVRYDTKSNEIQRFEELSQEDINRFIGGDTSKPVNLFIDGTVGTFKEPNPDNFAYQTRIVSKRYDFGKPFVDKRYKNIQFEFTLPNLTNTKPDNLDKLKVYGDIYVDNQQVYRHTILEYNKSEFKMDEVATPLLNIAPGSFDHVDISDKALFGDTTTRISGLNLQGSRGKGIKFDLTFKNIVYFNFSQISTVYKLRKAKLKTSTGQFGRGRKR